MLTSLRLAGGLVVARTSERTTLPFANKSTSSPDEQQVAASIMSGSESDLSDVPEQHPPAALSRSSSAPIPQENGFHAEESELSDEDGMAGSDDADFEIDSQPPEPVVPRLVSSSSEDSPRPPKRKAVGIEDDEDIMNNPELYGIRRSVRHPQRDNVATLCAETHRQRRARPAKHLVCDIAFHAQSSLFMPLQIESDSQEDDSDSDIVPTSRKRRRQTPRQGWCHSTIFSFLHEFHPRTDCTSQFPSNRLHHQH